MFLGFIGLVIVFIGALFNNFNVEFFGFSLIVFDINTHLDLESQIRALREEIEEYLKERQKT